MYTVPTAFTPVITRYLKADVDVYVRSNCVQPELVADTSEPICVNVGYTSALDISSFVTLP